MTSLKIPLQKAPWVSFSPLIIGGAAYLAKMALKSFLKSSISHMGSSSQRRPSIYGLFDLKRPSDQSVEASESMILGVFGDYLVFLLLSIIFNVMIMLFARVKEYFSRQQDHSQAKYCQSPRESTRKAADDGLEDFESISEPSPHHRGNLITKLIKASLCYTLVFCFFEIALFCVFTLYASAGTPNHSLIHPYGQLRTLEEVTPTVPAVKKPEKISLAMGRVLASFDVEPTEIALSQDEKWAYVSTQNPQLIRVYDTSNFKTPTQVTTVTLGDTARPKMFLELSPDGTILVASNYEDVMVINVTTPEFPQLIGSFNSPMYKGSDGMVSVSMAISPDNKYLFMAEVGFAILDISDPSKVSLLYTSVKRDSKGTGTLISFSASQDRKLLYLTTGSKTLELYNVENPSDPQLVSKTPITDSTATSVYLSKDNKLAYVVGLSVKKIAVNILDISDPMKIKEKSKFAVATSRTSAPLIQALSPQETKLYIVQQQQLMIIDLLAKSVESNNENLVKNTLVSLAFSSNGQYAGVASLEQIVFIELFTDYPNSKIFTSSNSSTSSFVIDHRFESWAVNNEGNTVFLASNDYAREKTAFEIWSVITSKKTASLNAAYFGVTLTAPLLSFRMSQDNKRAYLKWWTRETSKLMIVDISGSLKTPKKLREYEIPLSLNFEDFVFSSDEKILCTAADPNTIKLYDEVGFKSEIKITSDLLTGSFDLAFAKNNKILLVITSKIAIYNVEDLSNPTFLGSVSMTEGGSPRILSVLVLEEENTLIIEWYQTARKLRIYNISDIASPKLTSEFALPKRTFSDGQDLRPEFYGPFVYAKSQKMGYVGTNGKLLKLDLSDFKNPVVASIVPVATCEGCGGVSRFLISPDGNTAFATNQAGTLKSMKLNSESLDLYKGSDVNSQIFAIDLQIKFTLYIHQEKFLLGERYSDNVFVLKNTAKQGYQVSTKAQAKVLKLYSYDVSVVSSKTSPEVKPFSLPDWIKFDPETLLLTIEPKSKKDLGTYTICSAISDELSKENLGKVDLGGLIDIPVDQVLGMLISLGYMDRQYHLTNGLGSRDDFFFPDQILGIGGLIDKNKIYDFLTKFYTEACTKIEIVPSLNVSLLQSANKIWIETPNTDAVKIDITLLPDKSDSTAQFVQKTYGPLTPTVKEQKSRVTLEGSLDEIHTALQNVVINAQSGTFYNGIVTIHDGINDPIVNRRIPNISECFLKNSPPFENPNAKRTFQEQIDRMPVVTGQYFAIIWDENTFLDQHAETLHYEVIYDNDENTGEAKVMPDWLTFSNLALRGTPPEKLTDREVPLKFIVKNEFQTLTIPFKLNIGISPTFIVSLLIKYSPMLLTVIGFYIQANKIYNVVAKKRYKHPKEYYVQVGQEISSETILPIVLIEEELKESEMIMSHLLKYLKKSQKELVSHFVDEGAAKGVLNRKKINETILEAVLNLALKEKKRLKLYLDGSDFDRKKITQLVINKISMLRIELPQEKQTKLIFETIKGQFIDIVEWDPELLFVVNKDKLFELLDKKNSSLNTEEDRASLVRGHNQELLQDALISHAFSCQSLNARSSMVLLEMHERFERNWVKKFLKKDLEGAHLNNKLGVDYGINCQLEHGVLVFSGSAKENFKGRTLIIQVQTIQLRILKEIWIHEKPIPRGENRDSTIDLSTRTESSLRGHGYEIY